MADQEIRQRLLDAESIESDLPWSLNDLPMKAKLKLARKSKEDPLYVKILEVN